MATPMDAPPLELKQTQAPKSLKHKHKNKRASPTGGSSGGPAKDAPATAAASSSVAAAAGECNHAHHHGRHHSHHHAAAARKSSGSAASAASATGATGDDKMRELLTSKIAEIEVGGEENLELPIDLSGIYLDDSVPERVLSAMQAVVDDAALSAEEKTAKLAAQTKKTSDDLGLLQKKISEINSRCIVLKQRKNAVVAELSKTSASKGKLEQLCRELQKQNKLIVSESRRIADEEDKKRRELSNQFQKTIEEVSAKMDQQSQDYINSLKENENLQNKLKEFLEQYAAREEHFKKQLEAKDLTIQLAEAKLQHQLELTSREAERAKLTLEKAKEFAEREIQLQAQLNAYSEKFNVVQETLTKSNEMFTTFRAEIDKMNKQTKKLEKENAALKKKCNEYDRGAIDAIQEKVKSAEETTKLLEKIKKLESLCRQLQAERKVAQE